MISSFAKRRTRRSVLAFVTVLGCCATLLAARVPAAGSGVPARSGVPAASGVPAGSGVPDTSSPVTGNATWFSGLGAPYGGCGLPQATLDTQNFLALNVQDSPGVYTDLPRPIPAADASEIGAFDNGLNCGRWVQVTIGDYCTGVNDGAPAQPFCRGGSWTSDQYNGATLDFVVADSCDDGNAWCKDDPYHVDLAQGSLNDFVLNGQPVGDMYPAHWNNRHVSWQFIPAPDYTGDIRIGAIQGAQPYWPAIALSHLPNGITGVQYQAGGSWVPAQMDADMGDDYIIAPTTGAGTPGTQYEIRVIDASGAFVGGGEVYSFTLPAACSTGCPAAYTPISYTTSTGGSPSPSPSPTGSPSPGPAGSPSASPTASTSPAGSCTLTAAITSSWPGGYQVQFTLSNHGTGSGQGWTAGISFAAAADVVTSAWNAAVTQSGTQVTASSESYDATIPAGGAATWGMVVTGSDQQLSSLTCSLK